MTPAASRIHVLDGVLKDPAAYRAAALLTEYRDFDFGHCIFRGIGTGARLFDNGGEVLARIHATFPQLVPAMTFFRRSPRGQVEPNYIHTDVDMGEWTGILYLNPDPPVDDGTIFWTHRETGAIQSAVAHERSEEGRDLANVESNWIQRQAVRARFNRLLLFPSAYFHSRAIFDNWGLGDQARLTQVVFGQGAL